MKLYRLLTGPDDSSFCHRVSEALSQGWALEGQPSICCKPDGNIVCAQAVTKTVENETYHPGMKLSDF